MKNGQTTKPHLTAIDPKVVEQAIALMKQPRAEILRQYRINNKGRFKKDDWRYWSLKGEEILEAWRTLARTDEESLRGLAAFLLLESDNIKREFQEHRKHYRKVAWGCSSWPGEMTVDKDLQKQQEHYAKALLLGRFTPINYGKKQWSRQTPEIAACLELIELMKRCGGFGMLPPFNRNTSVLWWERAELFFESLYGKDFENHRRFGHYWRNAVYKDQLNARALIRRDIKKQIKQAFRTIARKPAPVE